MVSGACLIGIGKLLPLPGAAIRLSSGGPTFDMVVTDAVLATGVSGYTFDRKLVVVDLSHRSFVWVDSASLQAAVTNFLLFYLRESEVDPTELEVSSRGAGANLVLAATKRRMRAYGKASVRRVLQKMMFQEREKDVWSLRSLRL